MPLLNNQKLNFIAALLSDLREVPSTYATLPGILVLDFQKRIEQAGKYIKELQNDITNH